jgi:hypothetical protein
MTVITTFIIISFLACASTAASARPAVLQAQSAWAGYAFKGDISGAAGEISSGLDLTAGVPCFYESGIINVAALVFGGYDYNNGYAYALA